MEEITKEAVVAEKSNKKSSIIIALVSSAIAVMMIFASVLIIFANLKKQETKVFSCDLVAVKTIDGWGYMNKKGELVIKAQFEEAYPFSNNGLALVFLDGNYGFINTEGRYVVNPMYIEARPFEEDAELAVVKRNGKYGYVDDEGDEEIFCQFDEAYSFHSDLALVKQGGKYGFIDDDGKFMINPIYDNAYDFNENGVGAVAKLIDGVLRFATINKNGKLLSDFSYRNVLIGEDRIFAYDGEFYYLFNLKMKQLFKTEFQIAGFESGGIAIDPLSDFDEKLIAFRSNESKYGFINLKGEVVIPAEYDIIGNFNDGLAKVKKDGKYGYINAKNEFVIANRYDFAYDFKNGYAVISSNYMYGLIDTEGRVVLDTKYSDLGSVNNDICYFKTADQTTYGYYNVEKEEIINAQQYSKISDTINAYGCSDDGYIVVKQGENYGIINKKGQYIINVHLLDVKF